MASIAAIAIKSLLAKTASRSGVLYGEILVIGMSDKSDGPALLHAELAGWDIDPEVMLPGNPLDALFGLFPDQRVVIQSPGYRGLRYICQAGDIGDGWNGFSTHHVFLVYATGCIIRRLDLPVKSNLLQNTKNPSRRPLTFFQ
jgi:hypothetical protein